MKNKTYLLVALWLAWAAPALAQVAPVEYIKAGNRLYTSGDYGKAILYYRAALEGDPKSAEAYQGLGNCYYAQSLKTEALECYKKALALNPANAPLASFVKTVKQEMHKLIPSWETSPDVPPAIQMTGSIAPMSYDNTLTSEQIDHLPPPQTLKKGKSFIGRIILKYKVGLNFKYFYTGDEQEGLVKFKVDNLTCKFYIPEATVYISSKYPEGSAQYNEIKAHEDSHYSIMTGLYWKYREILQNELNRTMVLPSKANPWKCNTEKEIKPMIKKAFLAVVRPVMKRFEDEMALQNGSLGELLDD